MEARVGMNHLVGILSCEILQNLCVCVNRNGTKRASSRNSVVDLGRFIVSNLHACVRDLEGYSAPLNSSEGHLPGGIHRFDNQVHRIPRHLGLHSALLRSK